MTIIFNDRPIELATPLTLITLLKQLNIEISGSALAVNNTIITSSNWLEYQVQDGDDILLFQAIAGG
ncbi:sulfur carrier protein ThiS [Candidatus Palibaumannia cicadellinicola]|uniref:Thiamine biosynthesis protein ThiS n=1 Tax=Baumannia cicadellinicola subsp. Homalodisca coagulata TaxID=374463 RepID=Q1LU42_BAUCH|nr:sulfur carrier protein ThiS [Candidatus Baumannia cicadellinicola]ABF14364.1 thiamine biosynthesis protein ThiS [Baumannia cicadellinicola str. Hc (Homalodisca coagulata)]MCJ7462504.1 sulfur carrier protein ThiS [Candidatus Baumannia cicadellinicola]MCJ7463102.1 sulfur carrier protein ThiS [Candidatus Baumannia cicadellinicola]